MIVYAFICAVADITASPLHFDQEKPCPICGKNHTFDQCDVLNQFHYLKTYMRELAKLWNRLTTMVGRHRFEKDQRRQERQERRLTRSQTSRNNNNNNNNNNRQPVNQATGPTQTVNQLDS